MILKTVLLVSSIIASALAQEVTIKIKNGEVKGRKDTTYSQKEFYAFQQIPYAQPPVGSLRFQPPVAVEPWDGVLDATENNKLCYQMGTTTVTQTQTEDCLYVNVYTPVEPGTNAKLPVMYYIYGGGFLTGHPLFQYYGPQYFMEQDVVVVAVSYRIGPFGFLSTGDTVLPGNMGLKDQSMGLKWVQENIRYFGGDPDKVTIFGLSAGGASVTLQMLSKQSQGLFRGVISESGSSLCPWAYQRGYKAVAYNMATYLDSSFNTSATSQELLTFLQSKTPEQLLDATNTFPWDIGRDQIVQGFMFAPVVEPDHEGAFLTQRMYDAVAAGGASPVPLMIGIMSEEQLQRAEDWEGLMYQLQQYDLRPEALVNDNMHIVNNVTKAVIGKRIKQIYTTEQFQDDVVSAIKYFSDTSFSRPIIHHAKLHSQFNDVFFYQFSFHGDQITYYNATVPGCGNVTHGEDNAYLWGYNNNGNIEQWGTARDILTTKRYVTLFANFAKNLNPTPEESELFQNVIWPTVSADNYQYLDINDDLTIQVDPKGDHYKEWVEVYETLAVKPYDTY
ncbi:cholinesterase 1 [Anoplophora glabripennis]|uniref:cholinesterase 1 n=1 Tax=Anoplophora glabripennis TaxID=217634 RepID=UPI000C762374|nr:cholinesterase 1 [Anoplophora glabripennis]